MGVSPALATYGYEPSTYGLVKTVTGTAHTVTNTYETNRNILLSKNNHDGTPTSIGSSLSRYAYTVNAIGQRETLTTTGKGFDADVSGGILTDAAATGPAYNWGYNPRGELTQANDTSTANNDRAYQFDAIGNRQKTVNGLLVDLPSTANYTANALNQYTAITQGSVGVSPAYDSDGNATAYPLPAIAGGNATLTWDAENRLIEVKNSTGSAIATYQYDYLGRRIQGSVGVSPALSTRYIYDGWNLIADYTATIPNSTFVIRNS